MFSAPANLFRALADPTRRSVLELLLGGEKDAKELSAHFSMSQQAVSLHLQRLRTAGLVNVRNDGRHRRYRLKAAPIRAVYEWAAQFKQLFDPYGHAWLMAEPPRTAARPALLGDRPHRRK